MNAKQAAIRLELLNRRELEHPCQQRRQFALARRRHQKIPERTKALALIGIRNGVSLAEYFVEERPLSSVPGGNSLANCTVEIAKILLNLPEVRQQATRCRGDVLKSLLDPGRIEHIKRAVADLRNLLVDFLPASF